MVIRRRVLERSQKFYNPLPEFDSRIGALIKNSRFDEAYWTAEESYKLAEQMYGEDHPQTAKSAHNFGWTLMQLNRGKEAEFYLKKALEIKARFFGDDSHELISTMETLVSLTVSQHQYNKARSYLRQMINLVDDKPPRYRINKSAYLCHMAELEENTGNMMRAEELYWESFTYMESLFGGRQINTARVMARLGDFYLRHENFMKAEYFLNRALKVMKKHLSRNHPDVKQIKSALDEIYQHY